MSRRTNRKILSMKNSKATSKKASSSRASRSSKGKLDDGAGNERECVDVPGYLDPELSAALAIDAISPKDSETGERLAPIGTILAELKTRASLVANGDTEQLEHIAVNQITTLDALFSNLVQRAWENFTNPHFEKLMKLGLKAQSQCARTLETLAALKNPAIIARQLNLAVQQVVNNSAAPPPSPETENEAINGQGEPPAALPDKGKPGKVRFAQSKKPAHARIRK